MKLNYKYMYMTRNNSIHKKITIVIVKQRISEQFIQKWENDINNSSKGQTYRIYKPYVGSDNILEFVCTTEKNIYQFHNMKSLTPTRDREMGKSCFMLKCLYIVIQVKMQTSSVTI
jgi:hypothetical protein